MCRLLAVSRTGFLQWRRRPPSVRAQSNARLDAQVAAGRPPILRGLRELGLRVGHERVRRSLRRQALQPVYKRPYRVTTDSNHRLPVAPNVLERRFDGWDVDRAWVWAAAGDHGACSGAACTVPYRAVRTSERTMGVCPLYS